MLSVISAFQLKPSRTTRKSTRSTESSSYMDQSTGRAWSKTKFRTKTKLTRGLSHTNGFDGPQSCASLITTRCARNIPPQSSEDGQSSPQSQSQSKKQRGLNVHRTCSKSWWQIN